MDARLVRAYLDALPDRPPDGRTLERVRFCLSTLQTPDVRYLVATVLGPDGPAVARVAAAVLGASGAPTGILGRSLDDTTVAGAPVDDELLGRAGTLAAASGYQLAEAGRDLGELSRREATVVLALTAFAEANQRVALLVDENLDPQDPAHAPRPDLVVVAGPDVARGLELVPDGTPVVVAEPAAASQAAVEERLAAIGAPALLGGRDHRIVDRGELDLFVRDDRYVTFDPVPGVPAAHLATGIAAVLALGVMGIRMREDWVVEGVASLRAQPVAS